ncbi:Ku protein [Methanobacterium sp. BAmetb5]|uniref:non-homologous end joining protein Ku n=1 Tax=Methanobacterium sp. BAmetb5 TaxID=2025351 RepID=UPI000E86A8C0|nr:Ku protein [Methanobacterium sp. BAmetb5]AXV39477.1 MAG: DNA-binding protein [Methanobacterium sp. BAmetb5]
MRSIWSGSIKFGTIFIPIRLYAASENLHIGFHLVHKTDCGRVHYKKVCEKDGKELEPHEIAKAIDIAGECIQFTDEEIKNLHPFSTRTMEILGFCEHDEVPQISLSKPYYLGTENPKKGGTGQSFHLLREVMERKEKVAVVKWVQRNNEYIGMLQSYEEGFLLKQLLYFEQVRSPQEVEIIPGEVDPTLLKKASVVVENMIFDFDWTSYTETYTQQLKELIEKKAAGEELIPEIKPPETRSLEKELEKMLAMMEE